MAAYDLDELRGLSLARQFPEVDAARHRRRRDGRARIGPIQSQTARSPYVGLGARLPGLTHDAVTEAYESWRIVRGSNIRGTVHTSTPDAPCRCSTRPPASASARCGAASCGSTTPSSRTSGRRSRRYAADEWRSPGRAHDVPRRLARPPRRDRVGGPDGQPRPVATSPSATAACCAARSRATGRARALPATARPPRCCPTGAVPDDPRARGRSGVHVASYGPASRHDVAWWSGLGLRQVDALLERLDLTWRDGPDGRAYADLPGPPAAREVPGVRLLPEFDALLCGYDPKARDRFVSDADNDVLWHRANGLMLAPVLVDGRIGGYWRLEGIGPDPHARGLVVPGRTPAPQGRGGRRRSRSRDRPRPHPDRRHHDPALAVGLR